MSSQYPDSIMYSSIRSLETFVGILRKMRGIAEEHAGRFESDGFTALFATLRKELSDEYLASVGNHLTELKFRKGVLLSAQLV